MALTDNLVSYWKLDESSGNAADSVGSNTLTNQGTATFSSGKINNGAALVRASNQYFSKATDIRPAGDWTMNGWIKATDNPSGGGEYRGVFAFYEEASDDYNGILWYRDNGTVGFDFYMFSENNVAENHVTYNITLTTGTWYMVTCVWDSSNTKMQFYLNGTQQGGDTTITVTPGSPDTFYLGSNNVGAGQHWNGMMDEWGMWSRALSSSEITQLYNGGAGLAYPFAAGGNTDGNFFMFLDRR